MSRFSYSQNPAPTRFGVVVLQSDETIELDLYAMRHDCEVFFSRVPSGTEVSNESLAAMEDHIAASAALFPSTCELAAVGYGCTSGTAQIGASRVRDLVREGHKTPFVTNPLTALIAACESLELKNLALLSPYVESVSENLRNRLAEAGIQTPVFGSFEEAEEAKVARIDKTSLVNAAKAVAETGVDGLFLSCTNLRTLDSIDELEADLGIPVLSSNQVMAWHMGRLAQARTAFRGPGRLFKQG